MGVLSLIFMAASEPTGSNDKRKTISETPGLPEDVFCFLTFLAGELSGVFGWE